MVSIDDISTFVVSKGIHKIKTVANGAIWKIQRWFQAAELVFTDQKMKAILITNRNRDMEYIKM